MPHTWPHASKQRKKLIWHNGDRLPCLGNRFTNSSGQKIHFWMMETDYHVWEIDFHAPVVKKCISGWWKSISMLGKSIYPGTVAKKTFFYDVNQFTCLVNRFSLEQWVKIQHFSAIMMFPLHSKTAPMLASIHLKISTQLCSNQP